MVFEPKSRSPAPPAEAFESHTKSGAKSDGLLAGAGAHSAVQFQYSSGGRAKRPGVQTVWRRNSRVQLGPSERTIDEFNAWSASPTST